MSNVQQQYGEASIDRRDPVTDIAISGMHCAGCVSRVERALSAVTGVVRCDVNLATERARVFLVHSRPNDHALLDAIEGLGFGARFTEADQDDQEDHLTAIKSRHDLTLSALGAMLTLPMIVQMVSMWLGGDAFLPPWLQFMLTVPVQFGVGLRFYRPAWLAVRAFAGNMDLLVVTGTLSAFGLSTFNLWQGTGDLYFEAAASVITLVVLGKWMESRAKQSATTALRSLQRLRPKTVQLVLGDGNMETISIDALKPGDLFASDPGDRLPADGIVVSGTASIDQSLLTGESMPAIVCEGDPVPGGALNLDGVLHIRATNIGDDATLGRIIAIVNNVQSGKVPIQRTVDRVAEVFVPAVLALAALTFVGWLIAGATISTAIINAVSLLVVACPCALGLATPTAITVGTGVAARHGILIRDLDVLERAHAVDTVVFDKTGTLTTGSPIITSITTSDSIDVEHLMTILISVQQHSSHPLAKAIVDHAREQGYETSEVSDFLSTPGKGVCATYQDVSYAIGSEQYLRELGVTIPHQFNVEQTVTHVARITKSPSYLGTVILATSIREDAHSAISSLKRAGISPVIISGDLPGPVSQIASSLGISNYRSQVLPEDKAQEIQALQDSGHVVAMVGDGINDAPALAAADVGIAMGGGADVANDTAALSLMHDTPSRVVDAISISRATYTKIRQNLFWAFAYNVVALPLAALGYMSPVIAGAAMALSSVSVVTNSLLLKSWASDN